MPLVRLKVPQHSYQIPPEERVKDLLIKEANMDRSEADAAVRRLKKGKFVDASFDLGEERAARAFMRKVEAVGLGAELYCNEPLSWFGSRPRPWFLKLSLAVLVGFGICAWLSVSRPNAPVTKVSKVLEGLVIVCWVFSYILTERPKSQAQQDWESKLSLRWRLGPFLLVIAILTIVSEPILGLVLLTLALGGVGFAFLIRMMNRD